MLQCPNDACCGGSWGEGECPPGRSCTVGHTGVLCSVCEPGYAKRGVSNECVLCDESEKALVAVSMVAIAAGCLLLTWKTVKEQMKERKKKKDKDKKPESPFVAIVMVWFSSMQFNGVLFHFKKPHLTNLDLTSLSGQHR